MTLRIERDHSLKALNSFGLEQRARFYAEAHDDADVAAAAAFAVAEGLALMPLGGGSNLLLTRDIDALVLRLANRGRRILRADCGGVIVEAEAGEPWHPFVLWTLDRGLVGLENLSLIPGTVGAAPIQNIGAYGVEIRDVFEGLTAYDLRHRRICEMSLSDCAFDYRDSLFKRQAGRYVILRVRFRLAHDAKLHLDYGPIRQRLAELGVTQPTAVDVSRAVCTIRSEKLPDPRELGNAGSFFKNPVVSTEQLERLRRQFPDVVAYPQGDDRAKLAAGWLIDRAGWKGFREGDAGVHRAQALVLVNYGHATGKEILALAQRIQADVYRRFAVELEIEPNVL